MTLRSHSEESFPLEAVKGPIRYCKVASFFGWKLMVSRQSSFLHSQLKDYFLGHTMFTTVSWGWHAATSHLFKLHLGAPKNDFLCEDCSAGGI